jgi:hypothetical protein
MGKLAQQRSNNQDVKGLPTRVGRCSQLPMSAREPLLGS